LDIDLNQIKNRFFDYWISMLKEEILEKEHTMIEILARLDLQDQKIKERVKSREYLLHEQFIKILNLYLLMKLPMRLMLTMSEL